MQNTVDIVALFGGEHQILLESRELAKGSGFSATLVLPLTKLLVGLLLTWGEKFRHRFFESPPAHDGHGALRRLGNESGIPALCVDREGLQLFELGVRNLKELLPLAFFETQGGAPFGHLARQPLHLTFAHPTPEFVPPSLQFREIDLGICLGDLPKDAPCGRFLI